MRHLSAEKVSLQNSILLSKAPPREHLIKKTERLSPLLTNTTEKKAIETEIWWN